MSRPAMILMVGVAVLGFLGVIAAETAAQVLEEVVAPGKMIKSEEDSAEDYDPWEDFNDPVFQFNYKLDRYLVKPAAKGYNLFVGDGEKQLIANVFDNVAFPKRFVNSLLQGKFGGAGRELARFLINSTLGGAGMTDVALYQFGIEESDEDTGQTLGVYGWEQSRYLVLPLLSPLTLRDGVGYVFDLALDPINYFVPFFYSLGRTVENRVNDRALNVETFEAVEEGTLDLYSAVRNASLKRREKLIKE